MNATHTLTPWYVDEHDGATIHGAAPSGDFDHPVADCTMDANYRDPVCMANAAHIVRCVNAHDELVAALREMTALAAEYLATEARPESKAYDYQLQCARAALAKVTP